VRLGLLADTHVDFATVGEEVFTELAQAGVTQIIVCGDVGGTSLAERLESIAPTTLVRGGADAVELAPDRVVVDVGGVKVGAIHMLPGGTHNADDVAALFGEPVSVVGHGGTHAGAISELDGILLVNPGSPNVPAEGAVRSLAIVDFEGTDARAKLVELG
jgi:putative phosphoesterase